MKRIFKLSGTHLTLFVLGLLTLGACSVPTSSLSGGPAQSRSLAAVPSDLTSWYTAMDGTNGNRISLFSNDISYLLGRQAVFGGSGLKVTVFDSSKPFKGSKATGWTSSSQSLSWNVNSAASGNYYVNALLNQQSGVTLKLADGSSTLNYTMKAGGWDKVALGQIAIPAGNSALSIAITSGASGMELLSLELIPASAYSTIQTNIANARSKATWMANAPVGAMYQWGEWGGNPDGSHATWPGCYANMNWANFAQTLKDNGADFLVWSINWTTTYIAAPIAAVDAVYPGRTSSTDYLNTLLTECQNRGIKVIFYMHGGHDEATTWWASYFNAPSAGYYARKEGFISRFINITTEIGNRYGSKLDGWMIDDGGLYYPAPFNKLSDALRAGNPNRVISFNSSYTYGAGPRNTDYEDYFFGEANQGTLIGNSVDSNGKFTAGPFQGESNFGNFQTQAGDWGVRRGDTSISVTMSASTFNSIATGAASNHRSMAYDFRMWENGGQDATSLSRFKAAAALTVGGGSTIDTSKFYKIAVRNNTNYVLEASATPANGVQVDVNTYSGAATQQWKLVDAGGGYYEIQTRSNSAYCADTSSVTNGGKVQTWTYVPNDRQQYSFNDVGSGFYEIAIRNNPSYCLDVSATPASGVKVQAWTYQADDRQQWQLVAVP